jgi:hypothetical protein
VLSLQSRPIRASRTFTSTTHTHAPATLTVREAINAGIDEEMARDPTVFIMGGSICIYIYMDKNIYVYTRNIIYIYIHIHLQMYILCIFLYNL